MTDAGRRPNIVWIFADPLRLRWRCPHDATEFLASGTYDNA